LGFRLAGLPALPERFSPVSLALALALSGLDDGAREGL
jgi:hypothetical protein